VPFELALQFADLLVALADRGVLLEQDALLEVLWLERVGRPVLIVSLSMPRSSA
jgi:hypothetical protein